MRPFYIALILLLIIGAFLASCRHSEPQPEPPAQTGNFSPPPSNRWEQVDPDTRIPVGIHAAEGFAWAPDDRPIYFHTFEEVDQRRPLWEPFFVQEHPRFYTPHHKLIALRFRIAAKSRYDRHFAQLPDRWDLKRGSFIGFGEPFAGQYLHMFECGLGASYARYYRVRDYIIECNGPHNIAVSVIADPRAPPPPRAGSDDAARGAPDHLPEAWLTWFLDARYGAYNSRKVFPKPDDHSELMRLDVFAYAAFYETGFRTERFLRTIASRNSTSGDYRWMLQAEKIPAEYCTESGMKTPNCLPNSDKR